MSGFYISQRITELIPEDQADRRLQMTFPRPQFAKIVSISEDDHWGTVTMTNFTDSADDIADTVCLGFQMAG
ncbi:hypothetical protein PBY51_022851 [Eleginops maclovinus]|uniref:Uncharacterized protein n=1 Tax=Eleginops maclovinus TaxID=56733 RepID=A0AAN7XIN5_ELEMC|nr:hypothetical protein PBY51_022851 [Eleginops maclovinus]